MQHLVMTAALVGYALVFTLILAVAILTSRHREEKWHLLWYGGLLPFYKTWLRLATFRALFLEYFYLRYEEPYLPETAYRFTPRW